MTDLKRTRRSAPVAARIEDVDVTVLELSARRANRNSSHYRVALVSHSADGTQEFVIVKPDGATRSGVMSAFCDAFEMGRKTMRLKLSQPRTGDNRRVESFELLRPEVESLSPTPDQSDLFGDVSGPPSVLIKGKRYNTSDGCDRQVLRIPAGTAISHLFQGKGSFHLWRDPATSDIIFVPTFGPSRHKFQSGTPLKDGSRDVYFTGLKRYVSSAKLNAQLRQFSAVPYGDGIRLACA